jgi:hypothetical protein
LWTLAASASIITVVWSWVRPARRAIWCALGATLVFMFLALLPACT